VHEIVVEERAEETEPRQKDIVFDATAAGDESTRALMSDDLHVLGEDEDDVHHGVIVESPGKRPGDLG